MFAKSDEIPSLPFQDIKDQNVADKWTDGQRAITRTELAPNPYFSNINDHLVDINVFAKFDEIPSLPFQDIRERPKLCGWKDGWMDRHENSIPPSPQTQFAGVMT